MKSGPIIKSGSKSLNKVSQANTPITSDKYCLVTVTNKPTLKRQFTLDEVGRKKILVKNIFYTVSIFTHTRITAYTHLGGPLIIHTNTVT